TGIDERFEDRVLERLAGDIDEAKLDEALTQIEIARGEQSDALGTYLDAILPAVLYDGDPVEALTLDVTRANLTDLRDVIREELIENNHRALITLHPDPQLEDRVRETEERWLADLERDLTPERRGEI